MVKTIWVQVPSRAPLKVRLKMKIPLRYQNTEYDCATVSFINALAYLYDREDVPVELLKAVYDYTLDVEGKSGVVGEGGTSRKSAGELAKFFVEHANKDERFNIDCRVLTGEEVNLEEMKKTLDDGGVIVARCWHEGEHYVLITKIDDNFVYLFDPYYFEKEHYVDDPDVAMVFHDEFTHNRAVKLERLFDEAPKDFSLLEKDKRSVILMNKK